MIRHYHDFRFVGIDRVSMLMGNLESRLLAVCCACLVGLLYVVRVFDRKKAGLLT